MINIKNKLYQEDLQSVANCINISTLVNKKILITGATGLIGSFLIDFFVFINQKYKTNISIFALNRNINDIKERFNCYSQQDGLTLISQNICEPLNININFNYIIHAASNAQPKSFTDDPVGTMLANFIGMYNLLEYARTNRTERILYISSGEIYGQGTEDIKGFNENYSGYIDLLNIRSAYPISKRAAETLCICYNNQYKKEVIIARPCHIYGPTAKKNDSRASAQFINDILDDNNIILKSDGLQLRSYCYIADAASAILTILLSGESGSAYNISNKESNITIRELAELIANTSGKKVIFENPSDIEKRGYNPVTKSVLISDKLEELGWHPKYSIENGISRTIKILKND
jgi:nucleoside-diphosphate-sugar epimerase